MTNSLNNGNYSRLSVDPTLGGPVDGVDFPHSGVFKALAIAAQGNYAILNAATSSTTENFSIVQTDSSGNTQFVVGSGKVMRDGKVILVPSNDATTTFTSGTPSTFDAPASTGNGYFLLVVKADNTLGIRDNGNRATLNTVPQLTAGDIPIAMIRLAHGESSDQRQIQYFTTAKKENSVSIGYEDSNAYTEAMAVSGDATRTTFQNKVANADIRFVLSDNTADEVFEVVTDDDADGDLSDTVSTVFAVKGDGSFVGLPINTVSSGADSRVAVFTGADGLDASTGLTYDGTTMGVTGNITVSPASNNGDAALTVTNLDVDQQAVDIDASNTTANVLDITANAVTTATVIKSVSNALTTGASLDITATSTPADGANSSPQIIRTTQSGTGTHTTKGLELVVAKQGVTASGKTHTMTGMHLDVDDAATNDASGTVNITGLDVDVTSANAQGTLKNVGLDVTVGGADTNIAAIFSGGGVGIGNSNPSATLHLQSSSVSLPQLLIESTDSGSSAAPDVVFLRDSTSPANGDDLAHLKFMGKNDDGAGTIATFTYADLFTEIQTATTGSENGKLHIRTAKNNTMDKRISLDATATTFNEDSKDINFRVESNGNANMLFVDGGTDRVGIGTATVDANSILTVEGSISLDEISAPSNTANRAQLYARDSDRSLRYVDGAGSDIPILIGGKHSIWIPAEAISPRSNAGCGALATTAAATNGRPDIRALPFDKSTDEHAQFTIAMPKMWDEGAITAQFYWTNASVTSGTVSWGLQGVALSNDDAIDTAFGTAVVTGDTQTGTAKDVHISAVSSAITIAGSPAANDLSCFQVYRDVSADNLNEDALLLGIKIFYEIDGSNDA